MSEKRTIRYDRDLNLEAYHFKGIMQKFPNHFHEHYVIGFIEKGSRRLTCKNREYNIETGDIILLNPLENHICEQIDNGVLDFRCINILPDAMQKAAYEITGKDSLPHFGVNVVYRSDHVKPLHKLHQIIMEQQPDFEKEELFFFLLEQLIELYAEPFYKQPPNKNSPAIQTVFDYISGHYAEHIRLDELASLAGMNKYTLLRAFTRLRGITPYRYLETVREKKKKKLLEQGIEPIEAAMQTGFVDQSHFSNFFKDFIGLTPKQYQNIFKDNPRPGKEYYETK